jgi:DNA gyrase subunit A
LARGEDKTIKVSMYREQCLTWVCCRCIQLSYTKTLSLLTSRRSCIRHYTSKKPVPPSRRTLKRAQNGAKNTPVEATTTSKHKQEDERVIPTDLGEEVSKSYLEYALSVILGRAIPDARDGLKPVHRRILYGMYRLGLVSEGPFRKCARVVGEVLGKYHPHGDSAVYDALVRMAQNFVMRVCLVDGHGNFGSVDHDPPAAMRYTECRLSSFAQVALLGDLDKSTVTWVPNFDNSDSEPQVLPAKVPNLLLNGSSGIAVGMATNIPPHHLGELCSGLLALIENPNITIEQLVEYIRGPDFPTGGIIMVIRMCTVL